MKYSIKHNIRAVTRNNFDFQDSSNMQRLLYNCWNDVLHMQDVLASKSEDKGVLII